MTDYISIRQTIDGCLHHPLLQDLTLERAVAYAVDFLRILGMPPIFEEKTEELDIDNHRALLPCDFHEMIQVRMGNKVRDKYINKTFRYSTDSFHYSANENNFPELTYKLLGRVIFTSIKEGKIEIAYRAIVVDNEGYPMIPDDSSVTRALELYIKKQCFTILFDLGKINLNVYLNVLLEYAFAVGLAQTSIIRPSLDQMLAITNMWNTLIPRMTDHATGFISNGSMERLKLL